MSKRILCALLVSALALSAAACSSGTKGSSSSGTASSTASFKGDDAAFGKFSNPVTVHIGMAVDPTDKTLPAGDSAGNNEYTRYLKENYNINVVVDWTAASGNDYNQKCSLAIASGKLPDGVVIYDQGYLIKAAQANLLYNITDTFKEYASSQVQAIMDGTNGQAMENVSYNGKMVALPNVGATTDGVEVMWIRKDWLDKLNLSVPKTVSDVEKTAKAFVDNKMAGANTIGILGPDKNDSMYCNFLGSYNVVGGFDPVFQAMDAYPGYWLDNNGKVAYGSTTDNTKKALQVLANWYKEGIIDPQMGTRDSVNDPINANQTGIFFGPWWAGGYGNGDSFKNDPNADWQAYPVYTDDGKWYSHMRSVGSGWTLISKNAKPEVAQAIVIMNNALVRDEAKFNQSAKAKIEWYPLRNIMAASDECEHTYKELQKVLKGQAKASDYNDPMSAYKLLYSDAQGATSVVKSSAADPGNLSIHDFNTADFSQFQRLYSILVGDRPFTTVPIDKKVYSVTYGLTDTMQTKWANLKKLEDATILKIVLGQAPVSSFDDFVKQWKSQGGDQITAEVQKLDK